MKALTVVPLEADSGELTDMPEPPESDGPVLVETIAIVVCGTDLEICPGGYGWAPPGEQRLVLGHGSLGRVLEAPAGDELAKGGPGRPHRAPTRPCALLQLRGARMGFLPQRPVHRARHQAAPRLWVPRLVPLEKWGALTRRQDDVKVVIEVNSP